MSREYRGIRIVIYPAYFDANLSRKEGRRVPLSISVPNPTVEEIVKVCERLELNPTLDSGKYYPRQSRRHGRVIVDKRGSKLSTLRMIAQLLKEMRKTIR